MTQRPERAELEKIYRAAVAAVEPARLVGAAMDGGCAGAEQVPDLVNGAARILLLAVGKAALGMAGEVERRVGDRLADAIAVIPKVSAATAERDLILKKVRVAVSAHPVPDESSEQAAHLACEMLRGTSADDLVIVALSGGASAMFTRPAEGLTLDDKIAVNQALLKAGASIRELNVVRKHLSAVKGGRLLHHCGGARVLGLIISDVPGNDLATIGSGLTAGDWSSFGDAVAVLKRRAVWGRAPEAARSYLERAVAGEVGAMVKIGDPILERVTNVIIGDSNLALEGAERAAGNSGIIRSDGRRCMARPTTRAARWRSTCVRSRTSGWRYRGWRAGGDGARRREGRPGAAMRARDGDRAVANRARAANRGAGCGHRRNRRADRRRGRVRVAGDGGRRRARRGRRRDRIDAQRLVQFFHGVGGTVRDGADGTNVSDVFFGLVNY